MDQQWSPRMSTHEPEDLVTSLDKADYLRQRMNPLPGDPIYLHLVDLRRCLGQFASDAPLTILDFGCGGSPYRSLFPNATYHRADYVAMAGIDFLVHPSGHVPEAPAETYDLVLSTQVLEHVGDPKIYLAEALRLLKPGGTLLLTTHGTYPDHGCPHDYWRWTSDGLHLELTRAGFQVRQIHRLTCGVRAVLFWLGQISFLPIEPGLSLKKLALRTLRRLCHASMGVANRLIDRLSMSSGQMTSHSGAALDFYVALLATATKT
jgi:SAM-dependent methyltransferase